MSPDSAPPDVQSLRDKLREFSESLPPGEQALFQALGQRWAALEAAQQAAAQPAHAGASQFPVLEVADGPAAGQLLLFATAEVSIGRAKGSDLVIDDRQVSSRHAHLEQRADSGCWLVDDASTNGTGLNGQRVSEPLRLREGDLISIGSTSLRFHEPVPGRDQPVSEAAAAS